MEKIIEGQFILIINGPSCGGKSTVSDVLFEKYGGIYKGKSDAIKWLISDYNPEVHRQTVHQMTNQTIKVALANGLSVIKEGALWKPEEYLEMAREFKVPFFVANVESPWDVLCERFQKRVAAKKAGTKISNASPERFKVLHDMYQKTKMKSELEFDSSKQTPEQIAETIVLYIRSK